MLDRRQHGFALWTVIFSLLVSMLAAQYLFESLTAVLGLVHRWQFSQKTLLEVKTITQQLVASTPQSGFHHAQTFDYSWQYLGEYRCIIRCEPKCYGTEQWLLTVNLNQMRFMSRVAWVNTALTCPKSLGLKLGGPMMYDNVLVRGGNRRGRT